MKQQAVRSIELRFSDENAMSFAGLSLAERLALRPGFWGEVQKRVPQRGGKFRWLPIIKSAVAGLLSGARGTYATEPARNDDAPRDLLGVTDAPEKATFWRSLKGLGQPEIRRILETVQRIWTRKILSRATRRDLLREGFFPVFGDGTLLEGSARREGTRYCDGKGLLWSTWFCGPLVVGQTLAARGESEQSTLRDMLDDIAEDVLEALNLKDRALVLTDSVHGDGPTLDRLEGHSLHCAVGANKLAKGEVLLQERAEWEWQSTSANARMGWAASGVCEC